MEKKIEDTEPKLDKFKANGIVLMDEAPIGVMLIDDILGIVPMEPSQGIIATDETMGISKKRKM